MTPKIISIRKKQSCYICNQPIERHTKTWFKPGNSSLYWHLNCSAETEYPALGLIDNLMLAWFNSCHQNWKFI